MSSNFLYSANGKISTILHVSPRAHISERHVLRPRPRRHLPRSIFYILEKHEDLFNEIKRSDADFYVLVKMDKKMKERAKEHKLSFGRLLPFNDGPPAQVITPSAWTQDVFEVFPETKTIFYREGGVHIFRKIAEELLEWKAPNLLRMPGMQRPGNVLIGGYEKKTNKETQVINYIISYLPGPENDSNVEHLRNTYSINKVIRLDIGLPPKLANTFYHTDMFVTIMGRGDTGVYNNKEVVLLAEVESDNKDLANEAKLFLEEAAKQLDKGFKAAGINDYVIIRVPMRLFADVNGYSILGLSMNNCIAENYSVVGGRKISVIAPYYEETLASFFEEHPLILAGLKGESPKKKGTEKAKTAAEKIANSLKDEFKKRLKGLVKEDDFFFVNHDFSKMMKNRHAGLHCLVKVIERGNVW